MRVAVTGTIDPNGNVGEIGGIEQKAVAARAAGVTLFIVPQCAPTDPAPYLAGCKADLAKAAKRAGKKITVRPVSTFAQALAALRANGGAPVATTVPTTKPSPAKPTKPKLPRVDSNDFPLVVAPDSAAAQAMEKIGTVGADGRYSGKNVTGGVPVYAQSPKTKGFAQGVAVHEPGHDIFVPRRFVAYVR